MGCIPTRTRRLTLDDLMEIGQLSNTQLDALTTFEGALARYDLQEWNFARADNLRDHWRFLATVPAEMRLDLINGKELQANKLPLALQKKFIPLAVHDPDTDLRPGSKGMENPTLRIEYLPGNIPPDRPNLKSLLLAILSCSFIRMAIRRITSMTAAPVSSARSMPSSARSPPDWKNSANIKRFRLPEEGCSSGRQANESSTLAQMARLDVNKLLHHCAKSL